MTQAVRTSKGLETRGRILDVARTLLVSGGYDAVVLREVAKQAGIKLGNLQYYFSTRDALLLALIERESTTDIEEIGSAFEGHGDPQEALRQTVHRLLTRWTGDSGRVFATLNYLSTQKSTFRELHRDIYARFYARLEAAIKQADPGHPKQVYGNRARLLAALIDGAPIQAIAGVKRSFQTLVANQAVKIALPTSALT